MHSFDSLAPRARRRRFGAVAGLLAALLSALPVAAAGAATSLEQIQSMWLQGQQAQALQQLRVALQATPNDPRLRFALASMQMETNQSDEAERGLLSLTQDHPDLADPFNNLAVIRAARGDLSGARDALEQALRLQPDHAPALENLGDVLVRLAVQHYERAQRFASGDKRVLTIKLNRSRALAERAE